MDEDTLDLLGEVVEHNPDVDLPRARSELELLGTFLDRNPEFDASAPDEKLEKLRALHDADTDVYVPERRADLDRLVGLLQRHDDVELLAALLEADDPAALLTAMGYGTGPDGGAAEAEAALLEDDDDDDGGWFSDDDDDEEMFTPEDLEPPGEKLGYGAGGLVCLLAVLVAVTQGITVYRDSDWVLSVEVANSGLVLGVAALAALVLGLVVGFVYRATADDVHDGYRVDLAGVIFIGPMLASVVVFALYMLAPVALNLVAFNLVDAVVYLVAVVVVAVIFGTVLLAALGAGVGAVVGLPALAGVFVGSLFGALAN